MVAVAVRDDDHVPALGVLLVLRALRVPGEERIDVDALAARAVDAERRVSEPHERAGHEPPPRSKDAASLTEGPALRGTSGGSANLRGTCTGRASRPRSSPPPSWPTQTVPIRLRCTWCSPRSRLSRGRRSPTSASSSTAEPP